MKAHIVEGFINLGKEAEAAKIALGVDCYHTLENTILPKTNYLKEQPKCNHARISKDLPCTLENSRKMAV